MRTPQLADNLRRAVLQAAIEGKLNDRTSEDAHDLLAAIQAEKAAQQKNGKQKKSKPLTTINEEEIPFAIPENWVWVRLGEIGDIQTGTTPSKSEKDNYGEDFPFFKPADLAQGKNITQPSEFLSIKGKSKARIVRRDSLLINGIGNIGKLGVVRMDGAFNQQMHSFTPYKNIELELVYFFLQSPCLREAMFLESSQTTVPILNKNNFSAIYFPLPPLAEQQQIVEKLNCLLAEIDELKTQEQALLATQNAFPKKLRAALLQAAVQGELNERTDENARDLLTAIQTEKTALQKAGKLKKDKPLAAISEEEIPFAIPDNWVWVRLGEIGETNIGLTYDKKAISDKGTIVLRSGNIQNDKIDLSDIVRINSDITQNKMCRKGDILICARNGSKSLVGKAAIINEEGFSFGAFMAIFRSPFNPYIFYYLHSPLFRSAFDGVGTTTINQITQDNLKNRLIPLPPLSEQQQIVAKLETLLAEIDTLENAA